MKKFNYRKFLIWTVVVLVVVVLVIGLLHGQNYLSRRNIRNTEQFINSFGIWAPAIVIVLMLLSTLVPPLPIPVPLVEIAAGLAFGFWEGLAIIWFAQVLSSVAAFETTRFFGKRMLGQLLSSQIFNRYHQYLDRQGPRAVLFIRMAMAAPFNIISFLAGMTPMGVSSFLWATILGVIPEVVVFTFLGSRLRSIHLNLDYLVLLVIGIGLLGSAVTFLTIRWLLPKIIPSARH